MKLTKTPQVLLVEDSLADITLIKRILRQRQIPNELHIVNDGVEAMAFLRREGKYKNAPLPHIILLDLNLPKKNGKEVLKEIKSDPHLRLIPVIILTTSDNDQDIRDCYKEYANAYLCKPNSIESLSECMEAIDNFWFKFVEYTVECS